MSVKLKLGYEYPEEVRQLFLEYTDTIISGDPMYKKFLQLQDYEKELADLSEKYGLPDGRLYIAYYDDKLAGCVALRKLDEDRCELKRVFVRPEYRGNNIGRKMIDQVIDDAKEIGYSKMVLDTLPFLKAALHIYKTYGFYEIDSYLYSPMSNSIYLQLDL